MTSRLFRSVGWITKLTRPTLLPRSPISGQLPNSIELHGMLVYNQYKWRGYICFSKLVRKYRLLTSVSFCTTHAYIIQIANIIMNDISCLPLNTQIKIYCFERLKSAIARKFSISFLLLYWNIQMFMSISMYRWAISEHEKWTNFSAPCFGRKKTHNEQVKIGKYFVFLVRSLSLFRYCQVDLFESSKYWKWLSYVQESFKMHDKVFTEYESCKNK